MNDCIFCKIINKELPAYTVYEDEDTLAFLDINPCSLGHTLVVPKIHQANFSELTEEQAAKLMVTANKVLNAILKSNLLSQGANLLLNQNEVAGQSVMHAHIHIIPRTSEDGIGLNFSRTSGKNLTKEDFLVAAKEISENLK